MTASHPSPLPEGKGERVLDLGHRSLGFIWNLEIGIWDLRVQLTTKGIRFEHPRTT
jgi:hypothetical protein